MSNQFIPQGRPFLPAPAAIQPKQSQPLPLQQPLPVSVQGWESKPFPFPILFWIFSSFWIFPFGFLLFSSSFLLLFFFTGTVQHLLESSFYKGLAGDGTVCQDKYIFFYCNDEKNNYRLISFGCVSFKKTFKILTTTQHAPVSIRRIFSSSSSSFSSVLLHCLHCLHCLLVPPFLSFHFLTCFT